MEKLPVEHFAEFCKAVNQYISEIEALCGRKISILRSILQSQCTKFVNRFHEDKKTKLGYGSLFVLSLRS